MVVTGKRRAHGRVVLSMTGALLAVPVAATAEPARSPGTAASVQVEANGPRTWVRVGPQLKIALPPGLHRITDALTVTVLDREPPELRLVVPAGGQPIPAGTPLRIEWASDDRVGVAAHAVLVSLDAGPFAAVPGCEVLDGAASACTWADPGPAGARAVFRVIARDASGNVARDDSDAACPLEAR